MTRGIDRMAIFHDDEDREKYLEILAACLPGEPSWGTVLSEPSWGTVLSVTPEVGPKNCPRSDLTSSALSDLTAAALEDGSLVPASCDKGDRPQAHKCVKTKIILHTTLPVSVPAPTSDRVCPPLARSAYASSRTSPKRAGILSRCGYSVVGDVAI